METFDFPYHLFSEQYPESSYRVAFGGGWKFASEPNAPDQVIYTLNFPAMWFYMDDVNPTQISITKFSKRNMGALRDFYQRHRLYEKFIYRHPIDGDVTVRFAQPLVVPKGVPNGNGRVEAFEIKLELQP